MSTRSPNLAAVAQVASSLLHGRWHPVQIQALTILSERVASPKEIAVELGLTKAKSSYVSHHVKKLCDRGMVELVEIVPVRGAKQHFYRATAPFIVMGEHSEQMTMSERLSLSCWTISRINADFLLAVESQSIDERPDRHLTRVPMGLDEQGLADLFAEHNRIFYRTQQIQAESDRRRENSGGPAKEVTAVLASFLMPAGAPDPASAHLPAARAPRRRITTLDVEEAVSATARMLRRGWHPLQIQSLTILSERVASPKEIALELGLSKAKAGLVSHHVRELAARGQVELVRTVPVRGANEHFYAATAPFVALNADAEKMTIEKRLALSCWTISCINRDFMRAVEAGTIDERTDRHLTRVPLHLDERAIGELFAEHDQGYYRTLEIAADSDKRRESSRERGQAASAIIASFLLPPRMDDGESTNR